MDDELRQMIEESDSEYKQDSHYASDDENYIPAANGGTGTPEDSDIEPEMIISKKKNTTSMKVLRMSLCLKTSVASG